MRFTTKKQDEIRLYLLEKVFRKEQNILQATSVAFGISKNTVSKYMSDLIRSGDVVRENKGVYHIVDHESMLILEKSNGDFRRSEDRIYSDFVLPLLSDVNGCAEKIWYHTFTEMMNNALEHSDADIIKVIVRKNRFNTSISVIDNGIGIFTKIKNHFDLETLDDARCELFKGKVTTSPENHSGEGIFFSSKAVDRFLIMSDGLIFTTDKYENDMKFKTDYAHGTVVYLQLSNTTRRNHIEIFDRFTDEDKKFSKTFLKISMLFDASPVSRSQAKRMCSGLDKFKEVTLDFSDVESIGQGFAHQVFAVYQKAHPDINLIPINVSPAVSMMIQHVIP